MILCLSGSKFIVGKGPCRLGFDLPHSVTWMDEGVITRTREGKWFAWEIGNPITEIIMTSHDEAVILAVQHVIDRELCVVSIMVGREVWGIYVVT